MNIKSLVLLLIFLLVGAAGYFISSAKQSINSSESIGAYVLPGLLEDLNNVTEVQLVGAGNKVISTLKRDQEGWVLQEKNNYPADISKLRSVLLSLAEAKIVEQKTANPNLYEKLGVEDVVADNAQGIKAVISNNNKRSELIVGKPGPQINKNRYVRVASSEQSWLVDKKIDLKHDAAYWLLKDILSIEPSEVFSVDILLQDKSLLKIKNTNDEDNTFIVTNLSNPDAEVVNPELHQITNALSSFQLLDVVDVTEFSDLVPSMHVTYQIKTGAQIKITGYEKDGDHYASFDIQVNEEDDFSVDESVRTYVSDLQKKTVGWMYKIPNVSYISMHKREEDVLAITEDQLN